MVDDFLKVSANVSRCGICHHKYRFIIKRLPQQNENKLNKICFVIAYKLKGVIIGANEHRKDVVLVSSLFFKKRTV